MIRLEKLDMCGVDWAQRMVSEYHYLRRSVDRRTCPEGYAVRLGGYLTVGLLLFGRPEATRCRTWYGSVDDVRAGKCEVTRWQVLNLSRVWLDERVQVGGRLYGPDRLPGFVDRRGVWRSTLASDVIKTAMQRIGFDYLTARPPCFLDEPYQIEWLLSYCDTRLHKGTIYKAAGFKKYDTGNKVIETWRIRLGALTDDQKLEIARISIQDERARRYRAARMVVQPALL